MHASDQEIRGRVRVWLELRDLFFQSEIEMDRYTRLDWMRMVGFVSVPPDDAPGPLDFSRVLNSIDPEQLPRHLQIRMQLGNHNLFAARLARQARDVNWTPQTNVAVVAREIRERGVNVLSEVWDVVNKVGFAVENTEIGLVLTRGLNKPKSEAEISEAQYLRYATYYLILAKLGMILPDIQTDTAYKKKVAAFVAKPEVQPLIKYWEVTLENLVAQLRK